MLYARQRCNSRTLSYTVILLMCAALGAYGQANERKPSPTPTSVPTATGTGTGIGAANGSGVGAATGNGIGNPSGTTMGNTPATGKAPKTLFIIRPPGATGLNSKGSGTGLGSPTGEGIGAAKGSGVRTNSGSATVSADSKFATAPAATPRTYIPEMDGRCYYVTNGGTKRYVARSRCTVY